MAKYIIIPARFQSSRLPGKALLDIAGKPMIQHVFEQAQRANVDKVILATDNEKVMECANGFKAECCMTKKSHQSGTERIAEVIEKYAFKDDDIVINLQCDEPSISEVVLNQLIDNLERLQNVQMATLCEPLEKIEDVFNVNISKVIRDYKDFAIYFSRSPIPWYREGFSQSPKQSPKDFVYYRHIGIYGYRAGFVKRYVEWKPSPIEKVEKLEQLRVLWYGEKIHVDIAKQKSGPGVDTKEDLELARKHIQDCGVRIAD